MSKFCPKCGEEKTPDQYDNRKICDMCQKENEVNKKRKEEVEDEVFYDETEEFFY